MKYIRTKDLIFNFEKHWGDLYFCKTKQEFNKRQKKGLMSIYYSENYKTLYVFGYGGFYMLNILKQADTIEELCDELIFDNIYHSRMTSSAMMHTKENQKIINFYLKQNIACYGAIWTDKGLIYVAKMNEKGELELL